MLNVGFSHDAGHMGKFLCMNFRVKTGNFLVSKLKFFLVGGVETLKDGFYNDLMILNTLVFVRKPVFKVPNHHSGQLQRPAGLKIPVTEISMETSL